MSKTTSERLDSTLSHLHVARQSADLAVDAVENTWDGMSERERDVWNESRGHTPAGDHPTWVHDISQYIE